MKTVICFAASIVALGVGAAAGEIQVPAGYQAAALGQNFMGGFDYLPDGDMIGMYTDPLAIDNAYIGIVDANGDGSPADIEKFDLGQPMFGAFVKVNPDGKSALFEEYSLSTYTYAINRMDLSTHAVTELAPISGSFDGAFDLAFIDDGQCYISANPLGGTTNKIFHMDLSTRILTEVASIENTYSGGIDVDSDGNLYYVKGKANYPVEPGDFSVLKFDGATLDQALAGSIVLDAGDAETVAAGLDGGYDIAWHSSGAIFVSDSNNGKIYQVAPQATFASLLPGVTGGFMVMAFFNRENVFTPDTCTNAVLAAGYLDLPGGAGRPDVYQIRSTLPGEPDVVSDPLLVSVGPGANGLSEFSAGDRFVLTVSAQPTDRMFDAYIVFIGPGDEFYSLTGSGIVEGIVAYLRKAPGLATAYSADILDVTLGEGIPAGGWRVYAALLPAKAHAAVENAFAIYSADFTIR